MCSLSRRSFELQISDHLHDEATSARHFDTLSRVARARADALARHRDPVALRAAASAIRATDIASLEKHLEDFAARFEKSGGKIHWIPDLADADAALARIARDAGVKTAVRGHSSVLDEIHATETLAKAGVTVQSTEFGEVINGLTREPAGHPLYPAAHRSLADLAATLHERGKEPVARTAEELTEILRRRLRPHFLAADMGLVGANFLLADSGRIAFAENQGNIRLALALPRVLVIVAGIDAVTASDANLPALLASLAASASGRLFPPSVTFIGADASRGCACANAQVHLLLVDNGRTARLAVPAKAETLRCIGCGACADVCPIYRLAGGKAFGMRNAGPLGIIGEITSRDSAERRKLTLATPLCGACSDICPVGINLHAALTAVRAEPGRVNLPGRLRFLLKLHLWAIRSPGRMRFGGRLFRLFLKFTDIIRDTPLNPVRGWVRHRTLPESPERTFRDWWRDTGGVASPAAHSSPEKTK